MHLSKEILYDGIYKKIFYGIYFTLKRESELSGEDFDKTLKGYEIYENYVFSDKECFDKMIETIFYSGFRAETVEAKMQTIKHYFPDYQTVMLYGTNETEEIMQDEQMIKNEKKIKSCIDNARTFNEIISRYGSFQKYVDSFDTKSSFENLMLFKEDIEIKLKYLGTVNSYYFMMEIGLPVLKPDIVVTRIFNRLGLIEDEKHLLQTVVQGRKMSDVVHYPIRVVDILLVRYGQVGRDLEFQLKNGICLSKSPKCHTCGIKDLCHFV